MNNLDFLKGRIIAHRGCFDNSLGIPENSIASFKKAIELGLAIELDIHVLKDNTVVVFHDDNLNRMTGINKEIKYFTYPELKDIKLLNSAETIPTLKEVLDLVYGKVPLLIEFKSDGTLKRLEKEAMMLLEKYKGQYAIQSFNPSCVNYFRKKYPNIPRGQLSHSYNTTKIPFVYRLLPLLDLITKPDFLSCGIKNCKTPKIEKLMKKRLVFGWTVRDKTQFEEYKNVFSNLICENIDELIK